MFRDGRFGGTPQQTRIRFNAVVVVAAAVSLLPLLSIGQRWIQNGDPLEYGADGYDWVTWVEQDGQISIRHVAHSSTMLRPGDVLHSLDGQSFGTLSALTDSIKRTRPGIVRTYEVLRGDALEPIPVDVQFSEYPAYLYPLTARLTGFAIWEFIVAMFISVAGVVLSVSLSRSSRDLRVLPFMLGASALLFAINAARLLLLEAMPQVEAGSFAEQLSRILAVFGIAALVSFIALLLHRSIAEFARFKGISLRAAVWIAYVPAVVLIAFATLEMLWIPLDSLTRDHLLEPYAVYCFVYAALALAVFLTVRWRSAINPPTVSGWLSMLATAVAVLICLGAVLYAFGLIPGTPDDIVTGWAVVLAQGFALVPAITLSVSAFRYGNVGPIATRAATTLMVGCVVFTCFVWGVQRIAESMDPTRLPFIVLAGLYAVLLIAGAELVRRRMDPLADRLLSRTLTRSGARLREFLRGQWSIMDYQTLADQAVDVVGQAFDAPNVHLYFRESIDSKTGWQASRNRDRAWVDEQLFNQVMELEAAGTRFHDTTWIDEQLFKEVWPHFTFTDAVWASASEINGIELGRHLDRELKLRRVSLIIPVSGPERNVGLLMVGEKSGPDVFNLSDVEQLREFCAQLTLGLERLRLYARHTDLIKANAEAEILALRTQINPHFLFNAFNSISALIGQSAEQAEEAVDHLAAILRHTLSTRSQHFVTVQAEITLVRHYLAIEQLRFGERLTFDINVNKAILDKGLPAFVLQTLVENAVKHGVEKRRAGGRVLVVAEQSDNHDLMLLVKDNGIGIPALFGRGTVHLQEQGFAGIGLRNIARRMERIYERADLISMESSPTEGTRVQVQIPVRT